MAVVWKKADKGIRYWEHPDRKHGIMPDRYYTIRMRVNGELVEEALGWASQGVTLDKARVKRSELKENKRSGKGPASLRQERAEGEAKRRAEEAARQRAEEEAKRQAEEDARRNVTLSTYFTNTYKPWAEATKAKAFKREDDIWRNWLMPTLGDLAINSIGIEQWDHLVKTITAVGLSERSREYITGTLRRIMKHARERRVITEAPPTGKMVGATAPKNNRRQRVISDEELQTLLAKLKVRDIGAWRVTLFAAATGCRAGEAYGLKWGNLDLKGGTATFPKTKNGNARTVPLGDELKAMFKAMTAGKPTELVFPNQRGGKYGCAPSAFDAVVEEMKLNEGRDPLDRFSFHSLRHMAATRLARVLPLRGLMDVMGWTVAAMALRYSHTSEADRKIAAETLNGAFAPAAKQKVTYLRKRGGA